MTGQPNIINDISTLTRVPNKALMEFVHKANLCIGSIIADTKAAGEQAVVINIGIGTLSIDLIDMQCKFVPSKELKTTIKTCVTTGPVDPLELALEQAIIDKLVNFCNEVI
jgi:hypothetical protein